jgi:carbonic anhydrase
MAQLTELLSRNRRWATSNKMRDPAFFERLVNAQSPKYLWIGCSDSRVPANEIVALLPGELFVHRNVANLVIHTDLNCLSVLQYAVEVLRVEHVIVCGHYGCGGVAAADRGDPLGLIDSWLRHIQDVADRHAEALGHAATTDERVDRLCELNAVEQAVNVCRTNIVQGAWQRGQSLTVHAWIYRLTDGLIRDLGFSANHQGSVRTQHAGALASLTLRRPGMRRSHGV